MASKWPPVKNSAFKFRAPLFAQADNLIKTSPTLAAGDFKVSVDGGAFANLATLPSEEQTGMLEIDLSASEMNGDEIVVKAVDAAGDEWFDAMWTIHTVAQTLDTVDSNVDAVLVDTAVIGTLGAGLTAIPWNSAWDAEVQSEATDALNAYDPPTRAELTSDIAGLNDLTAAQVNAEVDTAIADAALATAAALATVDGNVDAILVDTAELQGDWTDGGRLDLIMDAILADTAELQTDWVNGGRLDLLLDQVITDIAALNNISAADVNAQVLDVLNVDTFAEPSAAPAATASIVTKIGWIAALARNKITQTADTQTLLADDGSTSVATASINDDGTTLTKAEWT